MSATLAVDRMSDAGLWRRLAQNHVEITRYGTTAMKASEVRAKAEECRRIAAELQLRGTQLELAG